MSASRIHGILTRGPGASSPESLLLLSAAPARDTASPGDRPPACVPTPSSGFPGNHHLRIHGFRLWAAAFSGLRSLMNEKTADCKAGFSSRWDTCGQGLRSSPALAPLPQLHVAEAPSPPPPSSSFHSVLLASPTFVFRRVRNGQRRFWYPHFRRILPKTAESWSHGPEIPVC